MSVTVNCSSLINHGKINMWNMNEFIDSHRIFWLIYKRDHFLRHFSTKFFTSFDATGVERFYAILVANRLAIIYLEFNSFVFIIQRVSETNPNLFHNYWYDNKCYNSSEVNATNSNQSYVSFIWTNIASEQYIICSLRSCKSTKIFMAMRCYASRALNMNDCV